MILSYLKALQQQWESVVENPRVHDVLNSFCCFQWFFLTKNLIPRKYVELRHNLLKPTQMKKNTKQMGEFYWKFNRLELLTSKDECFFFGKRLYTYGDRIVGLTKIKQCVLNDGACLLLLLRILHVVVIMLFKQPLA